MDIVLVLDARRRPMRRITPERTPRTPSSRQDAKETHVGTRRESTPSASVIVGAHALAPTCAGLPNWPGPDFPDSTEEHPWERKRSSTRRNLWREQSASARSRPGH